MNVNISDLPTLDVQDFNSEEDLLLIQKPRVGGVGDPATFSLTRDMAQDVIKIRPSSIKFLPKEQFIHKFHYSQGDRNGTHDENLFRSNDLATYGVPASANHILLSVVDSTTVGGTTGRTCHMRFFYGAYPQAAQVHPGKYQDFVRFYTSKSSKDKGAPIMHTDQFWLPIFENGGDNGAKKLIFHKSNLVNVDLDFYIIAYS